jgi:hypothetical protein
MKHFFQSIITIFLAIAISACAPVEDDIFTTAKITVAAGDEVVITRVQAQVKLTNVNTRQVTTSADFDGATLTVEVLRGAYQIDIEGVATCQSPDGSVHMHQFRCQSDYTEFIRDGQNDITLNMIILD